MKRFATMLLVFMLVGWSGCDRGGAPESAPTPTTDTVLGAEVTGKPKASDEMSTDESAMQPAASPRRAEGQSVRRWHGTLDVPGMGSLDFFVELRQLAGAWQGTIDIPKQGARGLALHDVRVESDGAVAFSLPEQVGARLEGTSDPDGDVRCVFHQAGLEMPCSMKAVSEQRFVELTTVERPQTPKPPFPYDEEQAEFESLAAGVDLAGTLTLPKGEGKVPAVVLISGSGAQDRDETIAGHKPFWVIADHLTRAGIAVLRVDDRGVGGSSAKGLETATTHDFALDTRGGVRFLRSHPRIDPEKIGLLGHSEGGIVAALVAAEDTELGFMIMLAGTGVPGETIIVEQVRLAALAAGAPRATADAAAKEQAAILEAALDAGKRADPQAALFEHLRAHPPSSMAALPAAQADAALASTAKVMTSPWYQTFLRLDPAKPLAKVRCPVLALAGSKDTQVPATQNLRAIERALARAANPDVTTKQFDGLNHLFQHASTGSVAEYGAIDETFAPEALETIARWIEART